MATTSTRNRKALRAFTVSRKAPESLRKAIAADDVKAFQKAFLHEIAKPLKRLRKQLDARPLLALWSESAVELSGRERELAASLDELATYTSAKSSRKKKRSKATSPFEDILENWLVESSGSLGPWETIVLAEILLRDGHRLSPERFAATLAVLADSMLGETIGGLFEATETETANHDAIRQIIATGESQWVCSLLLSPLNGVPALRKTAVESLEKMLSESTDPDGLVHGSLLRRLPDWLAPIARSTFWANVFDCPVWSESNQLRLTAVTEKVAMLLTPTMHHASADDTPETQGPALLEIVDFLLPMCESPWENRLQKLLKQCRKPVAAEVSRPKKLKKKEEPESNDETLDAVKVSKSVEKSQEKKKLVSSFESDSSCIAILRSGVDADADLATVEWHSSDVQVLLSAAGVPILSGAWNWSVRLDDEAVPAPETWKCSCWFLDPETVFVELEGEESSPIKRVRQMLLAPHDRFAMMTDSVTCSDPARKVQLVTSVPLADGSICTPDSITRELSITVGPRTVRTFPLWMEDDRILSTLGSYRAHDGQLELSGVGKGGVTLPLAFDWHPKRTDAPADWARLTVTENRRILGTHEAAGFRVRIGEHQVMAYRSLMRGENSRAVLGLHTWDETVYCRVPSKPGPLEPLVEVETPE